MSARTSLDVRPVEPRHRLQAILDAWDALRPGDVLNLTVDHEPACMYYTLRALHGEESFLFRYLAQGPLVWRVEVTRRGGAPTGRMEEEGGEAACHAPADYWAPADDDGDSSPTDVHTPSGGRDDRPDLNP